MKKSMHCKIDLHNQAVADKQFAPLSAGFSVTPKDSTSAIRLVSYDSIFQLSC